jgi:dipeptidase E
MPSISVLALSSSRVGNSAYLESALPLISRFLKLHKCAIGFIPFAGVVKGYDRYLHTVQDGLRTLPFTIEVVEPANAKTVIEKCDVIMVGGGNTFKLLHHLYAYNVFNLVKEKVLAGTPYIGWSAGSNITGASISTTNDMPIIQPKSFAALGFFPFQINPHYLNEKPKGFHGETRDERLSEFALLNPNVPVVGLPEGTALKLERGNINYIGKEAGVLFQGSDDGEVIKTSISEDADLSFLL